jgi:Transglycosylase SLT domain
VTSLLAVPGASRTSDAFRAAWGPMIDAHQWNGDAVAAVISNESGFNAAAMNPLPGSTAVGLLQFIHSTLTRLGFTGTRAEFAALADVDQLPYVEKYFAAAFGNGAHRPVDYYLATWGAPAGLAMDHVLAQKGDSLYTSNAVLDRNGDGTITVSDLDQVVSSKIASAGGVRLSPKAPAPPGPSPAPAPAPPPSSSSSPSPPTATVPGVATELATVRIWIGADGARGFTLEQGTSMHSGPLEQLLPWLNELGLDGSA